MKKSDRLADVPSEDWDAAIQESKRLRRRFIIHWTYCGETLSCNVELKRIRNGTKGHDDAVFQACMLVQASRFAHALKFDSDCSVWKVDTPLKEDIWDSNEANGGITWHKGH